MYVYIYIYAVYILYIYIYTYLPYGYMHPSYPSSWLGFPIVVVRRILQGLLAIPFGEFSKLGSLLGGSLKEFRRDSTGKEASKGAL